MSNSPSEDLTHPNPSAVSNTSAATKKKWGLSQQVFDELLLWLDPNSEAAGKKYEKIRCRLIKIFACRGCTFPEDLTDETINRVANKVSEIRNNYVGDQALYFYGVARHVYLEYIRKPDPVPIHEVEPSSFQENEFKCLERCMQKISASNRDLILQYYQHEKKAKIENRRELAERMGIGLNALRIKMHRIRARLQACVFRCLKKTSESEK